MASLAIHWMLEHHSLMWALAHNYPIVQIAFHILVPAAYDLTAAKACYLGILLVSG